MSDALQEQYTEYVAQPVCFDGRVPAEGDEAVRAVINAVRSVAGTPSLRMAIYIGQVVFQHVFHSDPRLLRARGRKCMVFKRLASEPELGMSPSSVWRAVASFELARRFPEVVNYTHTGVGHVSVVLGLPLADQFQLLRFTETERWSRRRLQDAVQQVRATRRDDAALPDTTLVERLRGLEILVSEADVPLHLDKVGDTEARFAMALLGRIRDHVSAVETQLARRLVVS